MSLFDDKAPQPSISGAFKGASIIKRVTPKRKTAPPFSLRFARVFHEHMDIERHLEPEKSRDQNERER